LRSQADAYSPAAARAGTGLDRAVEHGGALAHPGEAVAASSRRAGGTVAVVGDLDLQNLTGLVAE
jgi:hypothetical protein